jgi:transcriptional regulator with XRE-family HTH domain
MTIGPRYGPLMDGRAKLMTPDKVRKAIGQRIYEARVRLNVSQTALGVALGLDPSSARKNMSRYENGGEISIARVCQIAEILGVSPTELLPHRTDLEKMSNGC